MIHETFGKGKCLSGNKPNDKIYTPENIAKLIIDKFDIKGTILDAFAGEFVFFDNYPKNCIADWCEIDKGRDFFNYNKQVDWIITNPPYSILDEVFEHSFEIADNVVYLVPLSKIVSSMKRIRQIAKFGGVPYVGILSASRCNFPFGFPACAIHIKKGYNGDTKVELI